MNEIENQSDSPKAASMLKQAVVSQRIMSRRMAVSVSSQAFANGLRAGGGATNPTYSNMPYPAYGVTVMYSQEDDCGPDM